MNQILNEIQYVVHNSKNIKINFDTIKKIAEKFEPKSKVKWTDAIPFKIPNLTKEQQISFYFVLNSINFSYWGEPKWTIKYQDMEVDGCVAMIACLYRAIEEGYDILNSEYLKDITQEDLKYILRGNIEIPLFNQRLKILKEIGQVVYDDFDSNFENILEESDYDVIKLLKIITTKFSTYNDCSTYNDKAIQFHKRAQLLISDIFELLKDTDKTITNINILTAFADYKIPQLLRKINILTYSQELSNITDNKQEIPLNDPKEIEIRANMVWAIELLRKEINKRYPDINTIEVNNYIWLLSQEKSKGDKPYHLTRTIAY